MEMDNILQKFLSIKLPYNYLSVDKDQSKQEKKQKPKLKLYINKVVTKLTLDCFFSVGFERVEDPVHFNASWGRQFNLTEYRQCQSWQKVNHYCGAYLMGRKDNFHSRMTELKRRVGAFASFYPESYLLPLESEQLTRAWLTHSNWISKPSASSRGKGIKLFSSLVPIPKADGVMQGYIDRPLLITGRKFDIRIYVFVGSVQPLRLYIHDSGLGRFCYSSCLKMGIFLI